jgi:hypothetical protein
MVFDLSDHGTTDTIDNATLSLWWYYPAGKTRVSDTVVEIYRPLEWDLYYVTWRSSAPVIRTAAWGTGMRRMALLRVVRHMHQ